MSFELNSCQKKAVTAFIKFLIDPEADEFVIEGFAGTGKTTLVSHLLDNYDKYETSSKMLGGKLPEFSQIAVTATTRKAATVLATALNTEPLTIHSHLGLILRNNYTDGTTYLSLNKNATKCENELIIIDEASFIDLELREYILSQTRNCKIVYMGDPAQLISVNSDTSPIFGAGIPTARLETIMRHGGPIADIAAQYRTTVETGEFKPPQTDGAVVRIVEPEIFEKEIHEAFTSPTFHADKSAKVLAWTNARVSTYNEYASFARGIDEPITAGETVITNKPIMSASGGNIVYSTDKTVKIYSVKPETQFGIQGYDVTLSCNHNMFVPAERWKMKELLKRLAKRKEWRDYFEIKDTWGDLRPAYSSTVHKSQGSTYDKVFIDLTDLGACQDEDDMARLMYVAVSRASKEVVMCGELPSHYMGVKIEEALFA